jgi:membrane protein implicated in regulation of membrane protease activity
MDFLDKFLGSQWLIWQAVGAGIVAAAAVAYGVWWLAVLMIVGGVISAAVGVRDLIRAVKEVQQSPAQQRERRTP